MTVYLIVTRGLPGSGKTSWAKTLGHWRVNRDDLRDELHGVRDYTPEHEEHVTAVQRQRVHALLTSGQTVVADDTNLPNARITEWQAIANQHGATLVVADQFLRVPVEECIRRQAARPIREQVPEHVIRDMWDRYQAEQTAGAA